MSPTLDVELVNLSDRERRMEIAHTARSNYVLGGKGARMANAVLIAALIACGAATGYTLLKKAAAEGIHDIT